MPGDIVSNNIAVVLGANYYIGLSAIRCLGRMGIPVTAVDYNRDQAYAFKSRWCKESLVAPHYQAEPQQFIDFLIAYGKSQAKKPLLLPSADPYAQMADRNFEKLTEYYLLPNPRQGYYSRLMDKNLLHQLALEHDMAVPETLSAQDYAMTEKEIGFPCLIKPTDSPAFVRRFRVKLMLAHNRPELEQALEKAHEHGLEVIIQRIIPGFDDHMYTYDSYIDRDGTVSHWATCKKKRQYPVNYGASVFTEQKYVPELNELGADFLLRIGYRGFSEIEFKYDASRGKFYMIEINVRLSNLNPLLERAGLNFPYILYRDLIGNPLPPKTITRDSGLHFWSALEDAYAVRDYLRQGQLSTGQVAKSFLTKKVPSVWDWRDPLPALHYGWLLAAKAGKRVLGRNP